MVTRSIESAQRKVEARNFDMRKQLLEYDDVSNDQRKVIYQQRNAILDATDLQAQISSLRHGSFEDLVRAFVPPESVEEQWDIAALQKQLAEEWGIALDLASTVAQAASITDEDIVQQVVGAADQAFEAKVAEVGADSFTQFERMVLLQTIDSQWRDHLSALDYLRQGIHLRGYAQKQPKQEYKREAFELFGDLLDAVKAEVSQALMLFRVRPAEVEAEEPNAAAPASQTGAPADGAVLPKVSRNDPCPCGSGKKYKQCHGQLS